LATILDAGHARGPLRLKIFFPCGRGGLYRVGVLAACVLFLSGCASNFSDSLSQGGEVASKKSAESAGEENVEETEALRPASASQLQQRVMDFSDRFVSAIWQALDAYRAAEPDIAKRLAAQRLKVGLAAASMTIASSRDPRASLLDMAVFVSAGKWAVNAYWIPKVLGEKADGLRGVYEKMDRDIWSEIDEILTPAQRADLHGLIGVWKAENPSPHEVMDVRLRNLEGVVLSNFQESASARGLLSNVRRWLGKVDQSLLYGERMMFYIERMPLILSQQADLTVDRVAERFPIATVNPNFDQWANLANDLPRQIGEIFETRGQVVRDVMPQVRGSLESLDHITQSLQGTVTAADSLATKVQQLPFKPEDYSAALDGTTASLNKLEEIVTGLNRLLDEDASGDGESHVAQLTRLIDERSDRAMDAVFHRAALLIAMLIGGLLLVVIVARVLFRSAPALVIKKEA
jgi:hypothetical protein